MNAAQKLQQDIREHIATLDDPTMQAMAQAVSKGSVMNAWHLLTMSLMLYATKFCDDFPDESDQLTLITVFDMARNAHVAWMTATGETETLDALRAMGALP